MTNANKKFSSHIPKIKLAVITSDELIKLLPKLKNHVLKDKLLTKINSEINSENQFGSETFLSNDELLKELHSIKGGLTKALKSLDYISQNKDADFRCDYFYHQGNDEDLSMIKLANKKFGEERIKNSGYAQTLKKMNNGMNSYIDHVSKELNSGRNKNFNYCQIIISAIEVFEIEGFPYSASSNPGTGLFNLMEGIIKQNPSRLIKNAIENRSTLRENY
jgi:hypothetical protein